MSADAPHRRAALVILLIAVAAVAPTVVSARPLNEIPVNQVSQAQADDLSEPTSSAWNDTIPVTVPLSSAASTVPNADETSTETLTVRTARTTERLFVRLSWRDGNADRGPANDTYNTPAPDSFADAAAVQLPVNTSVRPGIAMGSSRQHVNVWYWSAETGSEELLAGGPGTTTRFASPEVEANAVYQDGRWHVVLARDRPAAATHRTSLAVERDVSVAFAVWNGSNMERSGRKAVSEWHYFELSPREGAALYETLLWAIAGIAIVLVVAVTAIAVRRAN